MRQARGLVLLLLFLLAVPLSAQAPAAVSSFAPPREATLFQVSSFTALLNANYDGWVTLGELRKHGDFGIGTFHALDGELVVVDGQAYRVGADGGVSPAPDLALTPFATVTAFRPGRTWVQDVPLADLAALEARMEALRPPGLPCAVRITGSFDYVKTRSVPAQAPPYPRLVEVVKTQPTFEFAEVTGVLVGFWLPEDFSGLNVPGYHLHWLTTDRTGGGHLLEARPRQVTVELQPLRQFQLILPEKISGLPVGNTQQETAQVEN